MCSRTLVVNQSKPLQLDCSRMDQSRCVIIGAARSIADKLPTTLQQMTRIAALWKEAAIVIAENGSTDSTKQVLRDFKAAQKDLRVHVLTMDTEANPISVRTVRLALVRNKLLNYIHSHPTYSSFDYILMVDMDGILDKFRIDSLQKAFQEGLPPWDALFANTTGRYYDIWALRSKAINISFDCWDLARHLQIQFGMDPVKAKETAVQAYQIKIPPSKPLLAVESAFGGLGLYRLAKTKGCVYSGLTTACSCRPLLEPLPNTCFPHTCEHVSFHKDMIDKHDAKLFIIPSIQVKSQDEHL